MSIVRFSRFSSESGAFDSLYNHKQCLWANLARALRRHRGLARFAFYEDENALWDDEDAVDAEIDNPPDKPKRKRKKKDTEDSSDESYPEEVEADAAEQAQRQIALEQNIIDRLEADAAAVTMFLLITAHPPMNSFPRIR